jgi:hypothetical protein
MYVMKVVVSLVIVCTMIFPHDGKAITIDQLTYHDPKAQLNPESVFPSMDGNQTISSFSDVSPRMFKYSSFLGSYYGPSPKNQP